MAMSSAEAARSNMIEQVLGNKRPLIIDLTMDSDLESVHTEIDDNESVDTLPDETLNSLEGLLDPAKGYAVVSYPDLIRTQFNEIQFLREQREFKQVDENQLFVLGGFQALGNPSSFHHPLRRSLMMNVYDYMAPLFAYLLKNSTFQDYKYISMIPDRFGIRRNDQQVGAETWHKDQSLDMERARHAIVFGGWINLDPIGSGKMQYFNCVPGEVVSPNQNEGFYERALQNKGGFTARTEEVPRLNAARVRIPVPPGHLVVFNELLTHEVAPGGKKSAFDPEKTSYRCYLKWFISKNDKPYWKQNRLDNYFTHQSQIGMSLFQPDAPFYASAHVSTSTAPLIAISERLIDPLRKFAIRGEKIQADRLAERYIGQGNKTRPSEDLVREGLVDWGIGFEPYTEAQKRIYVPRKLFL